MIGLLLVTFLFFAGKDEAYIKPEFLQDSPQEKENYNPVLQKLGRRRRRRRSAGAPPPLLHSILGSDGVPWRTGSQQSSAPESLHPASPTSPSIWFATPSSSEAFGTGAAAPRTPGREASAPHLHGAARTGKEADLWSHSEKHHHQRGSPPPPKRRTGRTNLSTAPPAGPYSTLDYIQTGTGVSRCGGGRGNRRYSVGELDRTRRGKIASSLL